jgi:hypothetical protein
MQNFNECLQAGQNAPTANENGDCADTQNPTDTTKITAKIIADFADWLRATDTFVTGFLLPAVIGLWFFLLCEQLGELLTVWRVL